VIVDGGDCLECKHLEPSAGKCTKHGYGPMELRDGVRECDDYVNYEADQ